jgi:DNA-binding SARP family transcriptional activator
LYQFQIMRESINAQGVEAGRWPRRKMKLLIKLLALQPRRQLHRERIQEMLWPTLDADSAANNLYKTIHLVRHALEPDLESGAVSRFIITQGQQIVLQAPGALRIDIDEFQQLAAEALRSDGVAVFQSALSMYEGDLLIEDLYEDWVTERREQLRLLHQELLAELTLRHLSRNEYQQSIERLKELVTCDPSNEDAHRELMRLYAVTGSRHQALRNRSFSTASFGDLAPPFSQS